MKLWPEYSGTDTGTDTTEYLEYLEYWSTEVLEYLEVEDTAARIQGKGT